MWGEGRVLLGVLWSCAARRWGCRGPIVPTLLIGGQCSRALVFADLNACIRRVSLYWGAC